MSNDLTATSVQHGSVRIAIPALLAIAVFLGFLFLLPDSASPPADNGNDSAENATETKQPPEAPPVEEPAPIAKAQSSSRGFDYDGIVVDAYTDEPIPNVRLTLTRSSRGRSSESRRTFTDAAGRFRFEDLGESMLTRESIGVEHPDYVARTVYLTLTLSETIRLFPGVRVTGEVRDLDGEPVTGGGEVHVLDPVDQTTTRGPLQASGAWAPYHLRGAVNPIVELDPRGLFTATVGYPLIALQARTARGPGASDAVRVEPAEPPHVIITVGPAYTLRGRIVDPDGAPVVGAKISCHGVVEDRHPDRHHDTYTVPWRATSDASGAFVIQGLPSRGWRLEVRALGFEHYREQEVIAVDEPVEVTLARAQWLEGVVVSQDGEPIAAASAVLIDTRHEVSVTDGGRFRSDPLEGGGTADRLLVPGYRAVDVAWSSGEGPFDLGTVMLTAGRSLEVAVSDDAGAAIAGAMLSAGSDRESSGNFFHSVNAVTSADGLAALSGLGDSAEVSVHKPGYRAWSQTVSLDGNRLDVVLVRHGVLRGRVVSAQGRPVFGARLRSEYTIEEKSRRRGVLSAVTSPDGRFRLEEIPDGVTLSLHISKIGEPTTLLPVTAFSVGEDRDTGDIVLEGGLAMSGRVETEDGAPVPDAFVNVTLASRYWNPMSTRSDAGGAFRLTGLANGTYQIQAAASGYLHSQDQRILVEDKDVDDVILQVVRGRPFEGRVVGSRGEPVAKAMVTLRRGGRSGWSSNESVRSDGDGNYRVELAPLTDVELSVRHDDYIDLQENWSHIESVPRVVTLSAGATVRVTVSMAGGEAVPESVRLQLRGQRRGRSNYRAQPVDGVIVRSGLDPGVYELFVSALGYPPSETQEIELFEDRTFETTAIIPEKPEPVDIIVRGPEDEPVPNARIQLWEVNENHRGGSGRGVTDNEGVFVCESPITRKTAVVVQADGYAPMAVTESAEKVRDETLEIRLDAESAIEVMVFGPDGEPVTGVSVNIRHRGNSIASDWRDGRLTSEGLVRHGSLEAGEYAVNFVLGDERLGAISVTVGVAEVKRVDFRMEPEITVTGKVLANGEPVSGTLTTNRESVRTEAPVDSGGSFTATVRGTGVYRFSFAGELLRYSESVDVQGPRHVQLEFRTVVVNGRVLDADGSPFPDFSGSLRGNGARHRFVTDEHGRFVLEHVTPGRYEWRVEQELHDVYAPYASVDISDSKDVGYRLLPARKIRIRATSGGEPIDRPRVYHLTPEGRQHLVPATENGDVYYWPIDGTLGAAYGRGLAPTTFRVGPEQEEVEVVVPLGGRLRVHVHDERGRKLLDHPVRIEPLGDTVFHEYLRQRRTSTSTGTVFLAISAGRFRVITTLPSGREVSGEVQVSAGGEHEIEVP